MTVKRTVVCYSQGVFFFSGDEQQRILFLSWLLFSLAALCNLYMVTSGIQIQQFNVK